MKMNCSLFGIGGDTKMNQDTSAVVPEQKDNHSATVQAPGSPCSVISSVSSVDGSSFTSSLSSSLAGSVAHSPAQADPKPKIPPKKKKKVDRMMMGYKKRRKRKGGKSKSKAKADEVQPVCDHEGSSPSRDCLIEPEIENPRPQHSKPRSNPLWNLASPPNDSDIDYNDFSFEQPPHFEMSIPDGLSPVYPLPTKRPCLDLQQFGINHWSQAATDPRFQPSVLLVRSKVCMIVLNVSQYVIFHHHFTSSCLPSRSRILMSLFGLICPVQYSH